MMPTLSAADDRKRFRDLLTSAVQKRAESSTVRPEDVLEDAIRAEPYLWASLIGGLAWDHAIAAARAEISRFVAPTDSAQAWFDLPEYKEIPQLLPVSGGFVDLRQATLEQYRESQRLIESRLEAYSYPRRSPAKVKADKDRLRQMQKLDPKIAPYFAGNPAMTMGLAIEMYQQTRKSAAFIARSRGGKAKARAYVKSTT